MAILSNGKFYGFVCSAKETGRKLANGAKEYVEHFVSGFAGHGWKVWEYVKGKWMLEIDAIRVRGQFTVFEMLISKVRAIVGAQAITQGCGKIKKVELSADGTAFLITLEDTDMSFMEHDFIRCQEFTGSQKVYHVEIESVVDGVIRIPLAEFDRDEGGMVLNAPAAGDDIVQFGNSSHEEKYAGRHSAIYMHADESGQPAIDVLDGIYSKDWSGCLKVRMGGDIPESNGGRGFYCVNGMIRGVDESGHTTYCLYPDGTAELGDGSALFRPDKSGHIAGGSISWAWNEEKQKYVVSMDEIQVEWENVKDAPGWIDEWTAGGTTIGDKYIVSPTGFFGSKDDVTNKITGILMGENIPIQGVKRTGIFALDDDETVFELEPETKKCVLKGTIYADSGTIGGFDIDGINLSNKDNLDAWISIEYKQGDTKRVSSLGNSLPGIIGYACAGYFEASGPDENYALMLSARGSKYQKWGGGYGNYALTATGGCDWKIGEGDHWCMPGVLAYVYIETWYNGGNPSFYHTTWGNGIEIVSAGYAQALPGAGNGNYIRIRYKCNHNRVMCQVQNMGLDWNGIGKWGLTPCVEAINRTVSGITKELQCTFWAHDGNKYIPNKSLYVFIGEPNRG